MFATTQNNTEVHLVALNMTVVLNLTAKIEHEKLTGQISSHKFTFGVTRSDIGHIVPNGLNNILKAVLDIYGIPQVNELGKKGMDLPVSGDMTFVNPSLQFLENSLMVATDVNYTF